MCADFRYYINRTGPRGPQGLQGEKGDPGNTFTVSEGVNTPTEYTLIFDGGDGNQFETDNLRNPIVDRGGTYVRYDRDNVTQYIGEPDMAVIDETPGIVNLAGKDTVTPNASDAVAYELLEKTVDELNTALENLDGAVEGLDGRLDTAEGTLEQAQGDISQAQLDIVSLDNRVTTNEGNITSLQSGKADKSTTYTKTEVNNALAGKANTVHTHTVSQITDAGALASQNTVDYQTQVTNKPTIPAVGNGTITLTQGGVTKGTFTTNQSGNTTIDLDQGGGSQLTAGNAINISDNVISVKYDGTTIGLNTSGQLQSLVEEPDMTQYYTKSQVDDLIPDVSGFASSIDVGTMFTGATETKENNVKLDVEHSYQNIAGGVQFVGNKYYLNWNNNTNNGFYAVPKTANETIPIINVCVYKSTSVEDPNTKQTTITTVPFIYVSDWLNSTGNRNVIAYTQDTYSFGTDTTTPKGMMDEEQYQAIQDLQNAGWNIFYKDNGLFQKVHSIEPSDVTGFYDFSLETIGYNFPLVDSTTGGINNYTFYMGWQQTAPTVAMHIRNTDNYSTTGMIFVSINITKADLDNTLNPTSGVTPDYEWENTRFAQYTDYASTQKAGLVKVGNNLSIAADGTLSADTQAPTAGSGVSVSGTAVSVNVDNSTITINNDGQLTANIPTPATVDQTYNASSTNAQSGVAIAGAGFLTSVPTATTSSLGLVQPDGTSIAINDGVISAVSSAPSNMVTTDTQQSITGRKDMAIINIQPSGSTGYLNYITPISSGEIAISKSLSYDTAGAQPGILLDFSNSAAITSVAYGGNSNYINMCTQYGNNTTEIRFCNGYKAGQVGSSHAGIGKYGDYTYIRNNNANDRKVYKITTGGASSSSFTNFFLESDMLDGTTISYDSTTGKISTVGSFVPTTRTINTKALSSDITLTAEDVGTLPVSDDVIEMFTTNYTVIGNPTITSNHVFSTTSGSDSLTSVVPFRSAAEATTHSLKFECQFRPTASSHSNGEGIFCRDSNSDGVRISLNSSACVRFRTSIGGTGVLDVVFSNTPLVQNILYKLTAEIAAGASSGTGTLYTSGDGGTTWTTAETVTLGTNTPLAIGSGSSSLHYFGVNTPGPTLPFGGEILLDKMYLEEDGVVIWTPVTITGDITEIGKATTSKYGLAKIDGTTIKTSADGKLGVINYLTLPNYADTTNTFDYSSMGTTSQTIPFDGWFVCASNPSSNGTRELLINGVAVNGGNRMTGVVPDVGGCYPVKKGDTVQFSGASNATNTYWMAKLIPFRSI